MAELLPLNVAAATAKVVEALRNVLPEGPDETIPATDPTPGTEFVGDASRAGATVIRLQGTFEDFGTNAEDEFIHAWLTERASHLQSILSSKAREIALALFLTDLLSYAAMVNPKATTGVRRVVKTRAGFQERQRTQDEQSKIFGDVGATDIGGRGAKNAPGSSDPNQKRTYTIAPGGKPITASPIMANLIPIQRYDESEDDQAAGGGTSGEGSGFKARVRRFLARVRGGGSNVDGEIGDVERTQPVLPSMRRPTGAPNRRPPSRFSQYSSTRSMSALSDLPPPDPGNTYT